MCEVTDEWFKGPVVIDQMQLLAIFIKLRYCRQPCNKLIIFGHFLVTKVEFFLQVLCQKLPCSETSVSDSCVKSQMNDVQCLELLTKCNFWLSLLS